MRGDDDEDEDDGIARMTNLLELLDGTLVDTTALVDQVTGSGGLAGIDVADNDDVDVSLLLTVDNCQRRVRRSRNRSDAYPMVAVLSLTVVWFLVGTVVLVSLELRFVALRCVAAENAVGWKEGDGDEKTKLEEEPSSSLMMVEVYSQLADVQAC